MAAYLNNYGQVESPIMCVRKRISTSNGIEVLAVVADRGEVQVLNYSYSSVFVRLLEARMQALDIRISALSEDEWIDMIKKAEKDVRSANGIL